MKKVTFKDLPSTETPINASNLNLVQNNIEEEFTNINNKFIGRITASSQDKTTTAGTEQIYKFASETINRGSEDTITINTSTGKATINKDIGLVRFFVNSQIYSAGSAGHLTVKLYKNNAQLGNMRFKPTTSYETRGSSFFYDTLSVGDVLHITITSDSTSLTMNNTSVIMEEL